LVLAPVALKAQNAELWPEEGFGLSIYNSKATWANQGMFAYEFTIDSQGLGFMGIQEISNLLIITNYGNIECSGPIDSSDAGRYTSCLLFSETSDEPLIISRAVATIDGKQYDITRNMTVDEFKPLDIRIQR
jgi:hypothetical protein